jgi:hypothetical protein
MRSMIRFNTVSTSAPSISGSSARSDNMPALRRHRIVNSRAARRACASSEVGFTAQRAMRSRSAGAVCGAR